MRELSELMKEYIKLFEQFQKLENEKLKAVEENNLVVLEQCINKEQAFSLALRGIEQKREKLQEKNGQTGMTIKEIINKCYEDDREELMKIYEEMDRKIILFKSVNDSAMAIIQAKMRTMDALMKKSGKTYNQHGDIKDTEQHMTNIKA